jgi:hypothetical protein
MKYLKRVSSELEAIEGGHEEEELMLQGVRFAFRVHQVLHDWLQVDCVIGVVLMLRRPAPTGRCSLLADSTRTPCEHSRRSRRRRRCAPYSGRRGADTCGSRGPSPGPDRACGGHQCIIPHVRHPSLRQYDYFGLLLFVVKRASGGVTDEQHVLFFVILGYKSLFTFCLSLGQFLGCSINRVSRVTYALICWYLVLCFLQNIVCLAK